MSGLVDTHCHLGRFPDPLETLRRASAQRVAVVAVTETPDEYRRLKTALGNTSGVFTAIGMHPERALDAKRQLSRFKRLVADADWIGEVGLDYSPASQATAATQRVVFEAVLSDPAACRKPMTVHSRRAELDAIRMIEVAGVAAVLHWWSGPARLVERALAAGTWFSVNSAMLRSERQRLLIRSLPRERVLVETDGPFVQSHGRSSEPADAVSILAGLASLWQVDNEEAAATIANNLDGLVARASTSTRATLL